MTDERPVSAGKGYSIVGRADGETVVLLHGVFFPRRSWAPVVTLLESGYSVVTIDLPGHGDLVAVPFTLAGGASWVEEVIGTTGGGPVNLVGWSLGGFVSMELAGRRPDLVARLVLTGASMEPSRFLFGPIRAIARLLSHVPSNVAGAVAFGAIRVLYGRHAVAPIRAAGSNVPKGMAALATLPGSGLEDRLAAYPGPTLLLNGVSDAIARKQEQRFLAAARHGTLRLVDHAGHMAPVEQEARFVEELRAFLADAVPDAPREA